MKILIVDDDKIFLGKLRKLLIIDKHKTITTMSREDGLKKVVKNRFVLILSNLKMPSLSGIVFLKEIMYRGLIQ